MITSNPRIIDVTIEDVRQTGWTMFKLGFLAGITAGAGIMAFALYLASVIYV